MTTKKHPHPKTSGLTGEKKSDVLLRLKTVRGMTDGIIKMVDEDGANKVFGPPGLSSQDIPDSEGIAQYLEDVDDYVLGAAVLEGRERADDLRIQVVVGEASRGGMDVVPSPSFGLLLKPYRLAAGRPQEALADAANLSPRASRDPARGCQQTPRRAPVAADPTRDA